MDPIDFATNIFNFCLKCRIMATWEVSEEDIYMLISNRGRVIELFVFPDSEKFNLKIEQNGKTSEYDYQMNEVSFSTIKTVLATVTKN